MIEQYLIEHCAPTLASIKTASLFSVSCMSENMLGEYIARYNKKFESKGIRIAILKQDSRALIYVYRVKKLEKDLLQKHIIHFLEQFGYTFQTIDEALECLKKRINTSESFPHEIGLFLGYPYEDVLGFIQNKGENSKCSGCWKVYYNECEAIQLFERYKKCKKAYFRLWCQGRSIMKLTVVA